MNFDLSEEQRAIRDAVDALCADFGADYWLERDRDGRWPSGLRESVLSLLAPVTQELALCYVAEQALGLPKSY